MGSCGGPKTDFDFTNMVWKVPREHNKIRKKTPKPILRPIIPEVVPFIKQAFSLSPDSEYAFTNADSDEPMGKGAPLALPYNIMQWLRRHQNYEMEHWSVHALRKTARTNFSTLTEHPHIAEIMLGHKLPKSWRVYDKHPYIEEQAVVYSAWWRRLVAITTDLPTQASRKRPDRSGERVHSQDSFDLQAAQTLVDSSVRGESRADGIAAQKRWLT